MSLDINVLCEEVTDSDDAELEVLGKDLTSSLSEAKKCLHKLKLGRCMSLCENLLDILWERLNTGHWKEVNLVWRKGYSAVSYVKALAQMNMINELKPLTSNDSKSDPYKIVKEVIKSCDMGLLMGCPASHDPLCRLASYLQTTFAQKYLLDSIEFCEEPPNKKRKLAYNNSNIEVVDQLSLECFVTNFYNCQKPVIIKGCMDHWPAMSKWDINYLLKIAGWRVVPVEIGSRYTDESWSQKLMTIEDFIHRYLMQNNKEVGYLAQHQLLDQIPELQDDIVVPDYCAMSENGEVEMNAWFGPANTISPLHRDEKHNIFCQVRGKKYIRLYDPVYTDKLYVHDNHLLKTTSQVDVENVDLERFPEFASAPFIDITLSAGDMLFIPYMYWHYVRSLSTSFSVSFWWT